MHGTALSRRDRSLTKRTWSCGRCYRRTTVICGGTHFRVGPRCLHMLGLSCDRRNVPFARCSFFLSGWARGNSSIAAVIADAVHRIVYDRRVVCIVDDVHVDVVDGTVVVKVAPLPTPALVAMSKVAVAVVDPTIKADYRTPVAGKEPVSISFPGPIRRSPVIIGLRSKNPCARNPVVAILLVPCPITRCPDVIGSRA